MDETNCPYISSLFHWLGKDNAEIIVLAQPLEWHIWLVRETFSYTMIAVVKLMIILFYHKLVTGKVPALFIIYTATI